MQSLPFDLATIPADKLTLLLARYRTALDQEKRLFNEHRKDIVERFEEKYRLYKKNNIHPALSDTEFLFFKNIKAAYSVPALMQALLDEIQRIRCIEQKIIVLEQDSLAKILEEECSDLCRRLKLPRDFKSHVIPDVMTIVRYQKEKFSENAGGGGSQ